MPHCAKCGGWISALVYECPACGEKPKGPPPEGLIASEIIGSMTAPPPRAPGMPSAPTAQGSFVPRPRVEPKPVVPSAPAAPAKPEEPEVAEPAVEAEREAEPPPSPEPGFTKAPGPTTDEPKPLGGGRPEPRHTLSPRPPQAQRPTIKPGMPSRRTPVRPEVEADEDVAADEPEPRGEQTPDDRTAD